MLIYNSLLIKFYMKEDSFVHQTVLLIRKDYKVDVVWQNLY